MQNGKPIQVQFTLPNWFHFVAAGVVAAAAAMPIVSPFLNGYAPFAQAGVAGLAYLVGLLMPSPIATNAEAPPPPK